MKMIAALLICCSSPHISMTTLMCGETLVRPEPQTIGGSRAILREQDPDGDGQILGWGA